MTSYSWPRTGDHCPQDIAKHASCLKADFDLVSKTVDISLSKSATIPAALKPTIVTGIEKGVAEARKNGYCPEWSKVDESIFREVMLKNITTEAARQARDRIPLDQFNGLRKSYNALHTKLVAQFPPTATSHRSVAADAPVQATSVGGLVGSSHGTTKAVKMVQASAKPVTSPQEKKGKDVTEKKSDSGVEEKSKGESEGGETKEKGSKEKESREKESREKESKSQDAEDVQAVTDSEDSESGSASSDDDPSASSSDSEEENEALHHTDSEKVETQEIFKVLKDGTGFWTAFNIHIKHQASVNQIYRMRGDGLAECSSSLLKTFLHKRQLSSQDMCIYNCTLVKDTGDVRVIVHAETREALQQLIGLGHWHQGFENTLVGPPLPRYMLIMHKVEKSSMIFQDRVDKSNIIEQLEIANRAIGDQKGNRLIITDISWAPGSLHRTASLLVEFQDANHANQAVAHGLHWRGMRLGCERADKEGRLLRCSRCQAYGHLVAKCTITYDRCGKCTECHKTRACKSKIRKCASCGGGHPAGNNRCPEKVKAKKNLEFRNKETSQVTKPTIKADRTPLPDVQRSTSAGRTQTEVSMLSPVSLDAESAEDDVHSDSKQHLPEIETSGDNVKSRSKQPLPAAETARGNVQSGSKQPLPQVETAKHNIESISKQPLPAVKTAKHTVESRSKQSLPAAETAKHNVESESKQPLPEVETSRDNVHSGSKQPLPQTDSAQDPTAELAILRQQIENISKEFAALRTILQSTFSGGTKRAADEAFVHGAGAESSGVATKRIKNEEPTSEDSMGLYRQPSVYSEDRPQ